jgi:hypothetical protein
VLAAHHEEGDMVNTEDAALTRRIRDIVAVVTKDIDAVRVEVEDGVAYIEGVVGSPTEARAMSRAIGKLRGVSSVVTCLSNETVRAAQVETIVTAIPSAPVMMHYYSLS